MYLKITEVIRNVSVQSKISYKLSCDLVSSCGLPLSQLFTIVTYLKTFARWYLTFGYQLYPDLKL